MNLNFKKPKYKKHQEVTVKSKSIISKVVSMYYAGGTHWYELLDGNYYAENELE